VGKSNFAFGFCAALASGGKFLMFKAPKARRVLYVEGEMDGADLQQMMRVLVGECENFGLVSLEDQADLSIPSIASAEGRRLVEEAALSFEADLLVLDSISTLANIPTNDEENWLGLSEWFKRLRIRGTSVLYLHHDGKNRQQRGHSKHEDLLNYVMHLQWPSGYFGADGLRCVLTFEKARRPVPGCSNLSIELVERDGRPEWTHSKNGTPAKTSKGGRPSRLTDEVAAALKGPLMTLGSRSAAEE